VWVMQRLKSQVFEDLTLSEESMMARGATLAKYSLFLCLEPLRRPLAGLYIQVSDISVVRGSLRGPHMNFAHLHLLLNHFPIIGTMVGLGLFLISLVGKMKT